MRLAAIAALSILLLATSCARAPRATTAGEPIAAVREVFRTEAWPRKNVDSAALWVDPAGDRSLLFITGKESHTVLVVDGETGLLLLELGGPGDEPGRFMRPNGVFVLDDILYVVERDNKRVQVFSLPGMQSLFSFGASELEKPYGIWAHASQPGVHDVHVTDDFDAGIDPVATLSMLDRRVKHYRVTTSGSRMGARFMGQFGDTTAAGGLYVVESILADPANDRLFLCDELRDDVKVYTMGGEFTGKVIGDGLFAADTEGLALMPDDVAPAGGYLLVTEQTKKLTIFHVFSRDGEQRLGAFTGEPRLANTDGIWLQHGPLGEAFPEGALYAIHDDQSVAAYSWAEIKDALGI
jgi:3-phytase